MNIDNMLALADRIELEDRFNLSYWGAMIAPDGSAHDIDHSIDLIERCDTVGCIAGWANAMSGSTDITSSGNARVWLGLTEGEAARLFHAYSPDSVWRANAELIGWESQRCDCSSTCTEIITGSESTITATQAAKTLRMIANGEIDL